MDRNEQTPLEAEARKVKKPRMSLRTKIVCTALLALATAAATGYTVYQCNNMYRIDMSGTTVAP